MIKTTEEDFNIFKSEIDSLLKVWGLICWETLKRHKHIDNETIAQTAAEPVEKIAVFTLNPKWSGKEEEEPNIKEVALHEVLELLLWKLKSLAPDHKHEEATEATHAIIQTIQNVIRIKNETT